MSDYNRVEDSRYFGDVMCIEVDPISEAEMVWGKELLLEIQEQEFDELRPKMRCVHPDWYYVTDMVTIEELKEKHGDITRIGLGPSGGFKWILFSDGVKYGHSILRQAGKDWASSHPRCVIECDKNGNERPSRRAIGTRR